MQFSPMTHLTPDELSRLRAFIKDRDEHNGSGSTEARLLDHIASMDEQMFDLCHTLCDIHAAYCKSSCAGGHLPICVKAQDALIRFATS